MFFSVSKRRVSAWQPLALVSALSTCFIPFSFAQAQEDKVLPTVVVTAARIEQQQTEALPHTTVITAEDIRNRQATDVITLLRNEAGIEVVQNGGPGMAASVFMRGANANQHLVLIDGVPIRDVTSIGTAAALQHVLPEQIERIEIVRGNVSSIYGSGAIGGVIQIFTKRGAGQPYVGITAEAGSRATSKLTAEAGGQSNGTRYSISATRFATDGFSAINTKQFPNENPDKDGDRNVSLAAAVSHEWSKGNELGARFYGNDAKFDYDGGGFGTSAQIDKGESRQHTVAAFSKNRISQAWLSTVTISETDIRRKDTSRGGPFGDSETRFRSTTDLLQWNNEVALAPNWILTAGADAAHEKADTWSTSQASTPSRSNYSLYSGMNGKIGPHSLQANLRYDHVGDSGSDTTGYLGYGYALTPAWKLIASASSAFLAPSLYQIFDPSSGNPGLKAERSNTRELGAQYSAGTTLIRATLFDTRTSDQIDYVITDYNTFAGHYTNIDRATNRGLELSASGRIAGLDARASLTRQNPKDDTTGEVLLRRAKTLGSAALSKTIGQWRLGGDVQYVGHRTDVTHDLPSFWLANLNARYQVDRQLSLFGRIDNVFDRDYQMAYGYDQPPRGVFVGLNWQM